LYAVAEELALRYAKRLEDQGVDLILLPGDTLDPCTDRTRGVLQELIASVDIPCHILIGNHETYGSFDEKDYYAALDLPAKGYLRRFEGDKRHTCVCVWFSVRSFSGLQCTLDRRLIACVWHVCLAGAEPCETEHQVRVRLYVECDETTAVW
jgi:hypothetical protein